MIFHFGSRLILGNFQAAYLGVDYENSDVLDDALENVDVVINLLGSMSSLIDSLNPLPLVSSVSCLLARFEFAVLSPRRWSELMRIV